MPRHINELNFIANLSLSLDVAMDTESYSVLVGQTWTAQAQLSPSIFIEVTSTMYFLLIYSACKNTKVSIVTIHFLTDIFTTHEIILFFSER